MHLPAPSETQFELPPAGTHLAICYRVIDLGTQSSNWQGQAKRQHKVLLSWELPDEKMTDGRPFTISQRYTWSMSEKAALRADLEGWRGVPFTEKDFGPGGFDIQNVIGKACLLTIVHEEKAGKKYANIKAIGRLMKGMSAPSDIANEKTYFWLHQDRFEPSTLQKLSANLQATIMSSPEYQDLMLGSNEPPPAEAPDHNDFHSDPIPF